MLESIGVLSLVAISVYLWMNHIESNERFEKDKRNFIRDSWTLGNFAQKYNNSLKEGKPIMSERSANTMIKKLMRDPEVIAEVQKRVEQKQTVNEENRKEKIRKRIIGTQYQTEIFEMFNDEPEITFKDVTNFIILRYDLTTIDNYVPKAAIKILTTWLTNNLIEKCPCNRQNLIIGEILSKEYYKFDSNDLTREDWLNANGIVLKSFSSKHIEYFNNL